LSFFCAPRQFRPNNAPQHTFLSRKRTKTLPHFREKTPFFSHSAPRFPTVAAHSVAVNARLACAHTRTPQSVFVFCLPPSRRGLSSLIVRALGVKIPPIFVLHRRSRRVQPGWRSKRKNLHPLRTGNQRVGEGGWRGEGEKRKAPDARTRRRM